jgi:hypothetical protein
VCRQYERTPGALPRELGAVATVTDDLEALVAGQPQGDGVLERRLAGHGANLMIFRSNSSENPCTGTLLTHAATLASRLHQLPVDGRGLTRGARPGELGGALAAQRREALAQLSVAQQGRQLPAEVVGI